MSIERSRWQRNLRPLWELWDLSWSKHDSLLVEVSEENVDDALVDFVLQADVRLNSNGYDVADVVVGDGCWCGVDGGNEGQNSKCSELHVGDLLRLPQKRMIKLKLSERLNGNPLIFMERYRR